MLCHIADDGYSPLSVSAPVLGCFGSRVREVRKREPLTNGNDHIVRLCHADDSATLDR